MRITFYISNHGFGHIMRNLPVAEELIRQGHDVVIVTGNKQGNIATSYLGSEVKFISCDTDAGLIVEPGTIRVDQKASAKRIEEHVSRWPELIATAPDSDVYVVDIVPWALLAARAKGIPSFFMSSFTWLEQYKPFLAEELLERYKEAFWSTLIVPGSTINPASVSQEMNLTSLPRYDVAIF
ncbi:MAG: hypothetical protein K6G63_06815, partial [Eubacterium sp.]|nr:hypothetical protein [Eubacterium sp.]